jgi:hypothetical protein
MYPRTSRLSKMMLMEDVYHKHANPTTERRNAARCEDDDDDDEERAPNPWSVGLPSAPPPPPPPPTRFALIEMHADPQRVTAAVVASTHIVARAKLICGSLGGEGEEGIATSGGWAMMREKRN